METTIVKKIESINLTIDNLGNAFINAPNEDKLKRLIDYSSSFLGLSLENCNFYFKNKSKVIGKFFNKTNVIYLFEEIISNNLIQIVEINNDKISLSLFLEIILIKNVSLIKSFIKNFFKNEILHNSQIFYQPKTIELSDKEIIIQGDFIHNKLDEVVLYHNFDFYQKAIEQRVFLYGLTNLINTNIISHFSLLMNKYRLPNIGFSWKKSKDKHIVNVLFPIKPISTRTKSLECWSYIYGNLEIKEKE